MEETKLIEFVPYDPIWPKIFEIESENIKQALGDNCVAIHHVGSTAVPGLSSKPKIDIIAVVKDGKSCFLANTFVAGLDTADGHHDFFGVGGCFERRFK